MKTLKDLIVEKAHNSSKANMHKYSGVTTASKVDRTERRAPGITPWIISRRMLGVSKECYTWEIRKCSEMIHYRGIKTNGKCFFGHVKWEPEKDHRSKWGLVEFKTVLIGSNNNLLVFVSNKSAAVWYGRQSKLVDGNEDRKLILNDKKWNNLKNCGHLASASSWTPTQLLARLHPLCGLSEKIRTRERKLAGQNKDTEITHQSLSQAKQTQRAEFLVNLLP